MEIKLWVELVLVLTFTRWESIKSLVYRKTFFSWETEKNPDINQNIWVISAKVKYYKRKLEKNLKNVVK